MYLSAKASQKPQNIDQKWLKPMCIATNIGFKCFHMGFKGFHMGVAAMYTGFQVVLLKTHAKMAQSLHTPLKTHPPVNKSLAMD